MERILHSSQSPNFSDFVYDTIVATSAATPTINGTQYSLVAGMTIEVKVNSVETGFPTIFLGGYRTANMFPVYFGNPGTTDYLGNPIINSNAGGPYAQSGNTKYAYYK